MSSISPEVVAKLSNHFHALLTSIKTNNKKIIIQSSPDICGIETIDLTHCENDIIEDTEVELVCIKRTKHAINSNKT